MPIDLETVTSEEIAAMELLDKIYTFQGAVEFENYRVIQLILQNQDFITDPESEFVASIRAYQEAGGNFGSHAELNSLRQFMIERGGMNVGAPHDIDVDFENWTPEQIAASQAIFDAVEARQDEEGRAAYQELIPPVDSERIRPSEYLNAAANGDVETVNNYLQQGRGVGRNFAEAGTLNSALILAASGGHREVVDILINANVALGHKNAAGENAAVIAERNGHVEMAAMLQQLISDQEEQIRSRSASISPTPSTSDNTSFSARLEGIKDNEVLPEWFKDVITLDIINDPIVIDGRAFDRESLSLLFGTQQTIPHPITRAPMDRSVLETPTCINIRDMIDDYVTRRVMAAEKSQQKDSTAEFKNKVESVIESASSTGASSTTETPKR